ncbi:methyltransferase domain-containing protein [Gordonia sp. (in: high G+C Gram-positive bacteria)]|uniref:methyltransferase domain-containing protein n=1 Tax=Gordonia sp. (in: high G+C Gram-positive bacteria) TaxID=84139 RepID=UPI0039E22CCE
MADDEKINGLKNSLLDAVAAQLASPHGVLGRTVVPRILDRGNAAMIAATADALALSDGNAAADVGFGGGAGIQALLTAVGPDGRVVGCDRSPDVIARAESRFAEALRAGRLTLATDIGELPAGGLDALMCVNTIYFVDDLTAFLAAAAHAVRGGGRVAVGVGRPEAMRRMPFTRSRFTIRELDEITRSARDAGLVEGAHTTGGDGGSAFDVLVFTRP